MFESLLIAFALAMDCFAVSVVSGVIIRRYEGRTMFTLAFFFGLFQALMPLVGWFLTSRFSAYIQAVDHWIAFGMLAFIGGLPETLRKDGRVMTLHAAALLRSGRLDEAETVLNGPIVLTDVREGNTLLTDLWFEIAALRRFGKADPESLAWCAVHLRPPAHLDFRML